MIIVANKSVETLTMKTLVSSIASPQKAAGVLFFTTLAFSPAILHLGWRVSLMHPAVALGPVAAGFWFAAGVRDIRVNSVLLGTLITTLLWSVNWLMFAGDCCATY